MGFTFWNEWMTKNIDLFHDIQIFLNVPVEFAIEPYSSVRVPCHP